ncbi:MAG: hypothetical protein LIP23_00595, partial [Planctomycetes bacterium]|nr:hypothetical protein [Planctomycetota bacterium]
SGAAQAIPATVDVTVQYADTALLAGLARNGKIDTVPGLPIELRLIGPDRGEVASKPVISDHAGRFSLALELDQNLAGGLYTVEARLPDRNASLGSAMFRIAEYAPEKLAVDMQLNCGAEVESLPQRHCLAVSVARKSGAAQAIPATVDVTVQYAAETFSPFGWSNWLFGDATIRTGRAVMALGTLLLDDAGVADASWEQPRLESPSALRMSVRAVVRENGRTATSTVDQLLHTVGFYIGVLEPPEQLVAGEAVEFPLAAVRPDGAVNRNGDRWNANQYRLDVSVRGESIETNLTGLWRNGRAVARFELGNPGRYRLAVASDGGKDCAVDFVVDDAASPRRHAHILASL